MSICQVGPLNIITIVSSSTGIILLLLANTGSVTLNIANLGVHMYVCVYNCELLS